MTSRFVSVKNTGRQKISAPIKRKFLLHFTGDRSFLILVLFLTIWGALMVYSGSVIVSARDQGSPDYYFIKHIQWIALGLAGLYLAYRVDYHIIAKLAPLALAVTTFFLILVLIVNQDQAIKRWLPIGEEFKFQPSELAKLVFLIYLAGWLAKFKDTIKINQGAIKDHIKTQLLPFIGVSLTVLLLIFIEPDLDTAIILGLTSFLVYFISGNDAIHFLGSFILGLSMVILTTVSTFLANYRITRFATFFNFWKSGTIPDPTNTGFQMRQILVAVASGGLFGAGFGNGRQKFHYLGQTAFTDTIFAVFAEEFGLVGCVILITLFIYLLLKAIKIAKSAPDKLGFLLVISMSIWLTLQAFMHIAANVALIPINGNTLPFFSYGGSSTVVNLVAVGIILNVSKTSYNKKQRHYNLPK